MFGGFAFETMTLLGIRQGKHLVKSAPGSLRDIYLLIKLKWKVGVLNCCLFRDREAIIDALIVDCKKVVRL